MNRKVLPLFSALALAAAVLPGAAAAQGITFRDVATAAGTGLSYTRQPSTRLATLNQYYADGKIDVNAEYVIAPAKPHGAPGIAIFDFDGDGDLDVYVTNGPGAPNSLFKNLWHETHQLKFVDVAAHAGVAATDQDSQGVCYGDIDNDGDEDLLVLGMMQTNRLYENLGNGTFRDISGSSGLANLPAFSSTSCAMGDVNGDGKLDIFITNAFDFTQQLPFAAIPFDLNQPNLLLLNQGGNTFVDASSSSGIRDQVGIPAGASTIDWAVTMVDFDQDGDLDILVGNDYRGVQPPSTGFLRFFKNDGTGHFTDASATDGLNLRGSYRGLSVGDLNCDGRLDVFASNIGPYILFPGPLGPDAFASKWFFGQANGTWASPGSGALVTVPTGWGNAAFDYDNDGDLDLVVYGGQDTPLFVDASNPGVILKNDGNCNGTFSWDQAALATSSDHIGRNEEGLAVGDLNRDGFPDIVSVSGLNLGPNPPLAPFFGNPAGSVFDPTGLGVFTTVPNPADPNSFLWTGYSPVNGNLAVEINSGGNGNRSVRVTTLGTVGITHRGKVNRDGIGALVSFTPKVGNTAGKRVTLPVAAGSSYASENARELLFGAGTAQRGTVDVVWPGGVRNRLYDARAGESVNFPEIPCSFTTDAGRVGYLLCVAQSMDDLVRNHQIDAEGVIRFSASAILAYEEAHANS